MQTKEVHFSYENFNRIFPFFMIIDREMKIEVHGRSIGKLFPELQYQPINTYFNFERPSIAVSDFAELQSLCNRVVMLNRQFIKFRGQFEYLSNEDKIIFLGAPWFSNTHELTDSGLKINDFAPHNPTMEFLQLLHTAEISNRELKELLRKINNQKTELEITYDKIKQVTTSLEESKTRYEYVNKATSEAIWDWNILTGEVYYGDGFFKLFGYETKKEPQQLNMWESRIHPEDLDRITQNINNVIYSTNDNWSDEYRYLCADEHYAFVSDKGFVVRNNHGKAIRMLGSMQDITTQKQEETRLKLLESVITHTKDSVLITKASAGHPIIYVNDAFTKITGYTLEDVKGKNPKIFQGPQSDQNEIRKLAEAIKQGQPAEITTINYKKNGEAYWINFSISPVFNNKQEITHWISVQKDATELIKANEEIIKQKKFTEDVLNNIPTDIAVFDPDHNYIFVNPFGIKNKEIREWIINKNDFDYARMKNIDDTMARRRWEIFEEAVEKKAKVNWIDEHRNADGGMNYVMRNFYPYFENNKLKFVIGYGIDITERKVIEIKLNEAIDSIKKTNSELEQFAYVASHDLQEPLRMVTSFLTQLEKKYASALDDKAKEYIHYAVDGAKRMRQIILDLLEFSRAGKWDDEPGEIDIDALVEEIKILLGQQIKDLNATIVHDTLPVLKAHKTPMRQVFQNLIGNSLKYHQTGIPPKISIQCTLQANMWEFIITDNGIGIEPQYFNKIFEIFQRLHNKDEYSGTGIGLAITRKIIERMGGKIWVSVPENQGSRFHFMIPLSPTTGTAVKNGF